MTYTGGCHCGAIRYELEGPPNDVALCHCNDCRKNSGAPVMAWAGYDDDRLKITRGEPKTFRMSPVSFRNFCGECGTGLFYRNSEMLPGKVEIQSSTLDDPEAMPPSCTSRWPNASAGCTRRTRCLSRTLPRLVPARQLQSVEIELPVLGFAEVRQPLAHVDMAHRLVAIDRRLRGLDLPDVLRRRQQRMVHRHGGLELDHFLDQPRCLGELALGEPREGNAAKM